MEDFVILISVIFGILSLILFFKVWGMCNNIKKIKEHLVRVDDVEAKFNFLMSINEKERAKAVLISNILSDKKIFDESSYFSDEYKLMKIKEIYGEALKSLGIKLPDKLEPQD